MRRSDQGRAEERPGARRRGGGDRLRAEISGEGTCSLFPDRAKAGDQAVEHDGDVLLVSERGLQPLEDNHTLPRRRKWLTVVAKPEVFADPDEPRPSLAARRALHASLRSHAAFRVAARSAWRPSPRPDRDCVPCRAGRDPCATLPGRARPSALDCRAGAPVTAGAGGERTASPPRRPSVSTPSAPLGAAGRVARPPSWLGPRRRRIARPGAVLPLRT